jgi:hypothetical protein
MKKSLFVVSLLIFILTGCAVKEDRAVSHDKAMEDIRVQDQTETASDISVAETKDYEPEELDYTTSKVSAAGSYTISYKTIGGDIKINRIDSWEVTVADADGNPVNDARLILSANMPESDHGLPVHPVITRAGFAGLYRVDNMKFDMPGLWAITFDVMAGETPDSVSFYIDIP